MTNTKTISTKRNGEPRVVVRMNRDEAEYLLVWIDSRASFPEKVTGDGPFTAALRKVLS